LLFFYHWHVTGEAGVGWRALPLRNFRIFRIFRIFRAFRSLRIFRNFRSFRILRIFRGNHEPLHAVNQPLWQSGRSHEHDHVNRQVSDFADALQFSPYFSFKHLFFSVKRGKHTISLAIPQPRKTHFTTIPHPENGAFLTKVSRLNVSRQVSRLSSHVSPLSHRALVPPLAKREPARGDVRRET